MWSFRFLEERKIVDKKYLSFRAELRIFKVFFFEHKLGLRWSGFEHGTNFMAFNDDKFHQTMQLSAIKHQPHVMIAFWNLARGSPTTG